MAVKDTVLWLRKIGIGRSLSALEIVRCIDGYLFPVWPFGYEHDFLYDADGESLLLPLLPESHPMQFDIDDQDWDEFDDLFPNLPIWFKGFEFDGFEEREFTQFDAIETFLCVSEVVRYLLSADAEDIEDYATKAREAVGNFSLQFKVAGAYFNRAVKNPNEVSFILKQVWEFEGDSEYDDFDCNELVNRFCEAVICLSCFSNLEYLAVPSDLPPWNENTEFLKELSVLSNAWFENSAFSNKDIFSMIKNFERDWVNEEFSRWNISFNNDPAKHRGKWCYYFSINPFDASVWCESGFEPLEAALWQSINYDPPDALLSLKRGYSYETIAPIVRVGMKVTEENIRLWGDAESSSEILSAIDKGFPNISEYQKYETVDADYLTIQRFNEFSKEQLSIQELSRAIALEKSWMDTEDAIAWSRFDQPLSDVVEFNLAKQTPLQASKWIGCGIPLSTALEWVALGVSQKDAMIWIENDVDINLAKWFLEHSIDSPREGKLWLKYIPKKEIPTWKAAEFDPFSASDWREIGFGPKTSLEWLAQGVGSAKEAGEWLKNKFELKEAVQWLGLSISAENAKKWRDKGVSPDIAQRREQAGIKP